MWGVVTCSCSPGAGEVETHDGFLGPCWPATLSKLASSRSMREPV